MPGKHAPPEIRFWRHVDVTDSCWVWAGSTNEKGYGTFKYSSARPPVRAHRYSWELHNDERLPSGVLVCHTCDTPPCVRPDHLFLGTQLNNICDMLDKQRSPWRDRESDEVRALVELVRRLTDDQIAEARCRVASGETQRSVARDLGVDPSTISRLINRRHWATLP